MQLKVQESLANLQDRFMMPSTRCPAQISTFLVYPMILIQNF